MNDRSSHVVSDDVHVPPHWHEEYITAEQLKGLAARWLLAGLIIVAATGIAAFIWAKDVGSTVNYDHIRLEELRREGTLPVQELKSDMNALTIRMEVLSKQLADVHDGIERIVR